ncbi:MAG: hypothetical protein IJV14_02005 [Lachnospiraceae bacterium]|nr:hypothetical protein [Lachnospiraceae bacterium]
MKKIRGKYLMVMIAMCGMTAAALGILTNTAGVFFTPVAESLGVGRGNVSMTLTISNLVFAAGGMLVPKVYTGKNFKKILTVSGLVFAASTCLLAAAPNLAVLYILNAVRGISAGLTGNVIVTMVINNWFHSNVGVITSIAMGCSGICGAVLSPILASVIGRAGWRTGYLAAGIIVLLLELPAILLPIAYDPGDLGITPLGDKSSVTDSGKSVEAGAATVGAALLLMGILYGGFTSYVTSYPQHFPGIAGNFGHAAAVGSGMVSCCLVCNTCGKLIFGYLADHFGAKKAALLYVGIISAGLLLLVTVHAAPVMLVSAAMIGFSYTLPTVGNVLITKDVFGAGNYKNVFPKINMSATITNAVGSSLVGYMYDGMGSYTFALILALVMMISVSGIVLTLYKNRIG